MNFLRNHWFDASIFFAFIILIFIYFNRNSFSNYQILMWLSLVTLFIHQFEEYRFPGYFPGMLNTVMFKSEMPDRFPLNMNTALIINVTEGWLFYFSAAVFAEKAVWLGIITILVSCGNTIAHTFLFNIKGKTLYNPGLVTSLLLFLPVSIYFFYFITTRHIAHLSDYLIGVPLGLIFNYFGILKVIDLLADKNTMYVFPERFLKNFKSA